VHYRSFPNFLHGLNILFIAILHLIQCVEKNIYTECWTCWFIFWGFLLWRIDCGYGIWIDFRVVMH
jgi:hypothetical protein